MKTDNWADDNRSSVKRLAALLFAYISPYFVIGILSFLWLLSHDVPCIQRAAARDESSQINGDRSYHRERGIYHQHTHTLHTLMCIHTERVCVYIVMEASEAFFSLFSLCMRCLSLLLVNRCIEARGVKIDPRLAPFTRNRLIRVFSIYYRPHLYFAASNFKPSTRLLVIKSVSYPS